MNLHFFVLTASRVFLPSTVPPTPFGVTPFESVPLGEVREYEKMCTYDLLVFLTFLKLH